MTWVQSLGPIWWRKETAPTSHPLTSTCICIHRERKKAKKEMSQACEKLWHSNGYYNYIPCVLEIKPSHKRFSKNLNFYGWKLQLGGERSIWLIVYNLSKEAKTRTHGRDLKQKTMMLTVYWPACSVCLLRLGMELPTVGWTLLHQLAILKSPTEQLMEASPRVEVAFFPGVSSFKLVNM